MTHEDKGNYPGKHNPKKKPDEKVLLEIEKSAKNGGISCALAHKIASSFNTTPEEIGFTIDYANLKITHCQLGLFGFDSKDKKIKPAESVSDELKEKIESMLENGKLTCKKSWEIADIFNISRRDISSATEYLKIRISECQLGAFK